MSLLVEVNRFIRREGVSATRIGREAVGDPRLVFDMRNGRMLRSATADRLKAYLTTIPKPECGQ